MAWKTDKVGFVLAGIVVFQERIHLAGLTVVLKHENPMSEFRQFEVISKKAAHRSLEEETERKEMNLVKAHMALMPTARQAFFVSMDSVDFLSMRVVRLGKCKTKFEFFFDE